MSRRSQRDCVDRGVRVGFRQWPLSPPLPPAHLAFRQPIPAPPPGTLTLEDRNTRAKGPGNRLG